MRSLRAKDTIENQSQRVRRSQSYFKTCDVTADRCKCRFMSDSVLPHVLFPVYTIEKNGRKAFNNILKFDDAMRGYFYLQNFYWAKMFLKTKSNCHELRCVFKPHSPYNQTSVRLEEDIDIFR